MKRNLWVIGALGSPILLFSICAFMALVTGAIGWLITGPEDDSRLIRIMSLPPLSTPQAVVLSPPPAEGQHTPQSAASPVEPQAGQEQAAVSNPVNTLEPVVLEDHADVEEALGFSIPVGSANSITYEGVATRLVIPKLELDHTVTLSPIENETWKVDHLGVDKVGHLEGTAPPGSSSNIVLAGHVTTATDVYGPFAELSQLKPGDTIYVYYGEAIYEYVIDNYQIVDRTEIAVTFPTDTGRVTLITCSNWSDSSGIYLERLVVTGYLKG